MAWDGESWMDDAPASAGPTVREAPRYDEAYTDDEALWQEPEEQPSSVPPLPVRGGGKKRSQPPDGHPYLYATIIAVCLILLTLIAVWMMPQVAGYFWKDLDNYAFINGKALRYSAKTAATYKQYRDYLSQEVIYPGVFVDGVHVGGMTIDQARQSLLNETDASVSAFSVTVNVGDKSWTVDNQQVPATRNLGNVLERAYQIGRTNTTAPLSGTLTPFAERVNTVLALRESNVNLRTEVTYDKEAVRRLVDEISAYVTREPVNSTVATFDFAARTFTFTDEQSGVTIDSDALYTELIAKLDAGARGESLTVSPVVTQPTVTKAQMAASFKMIAAYTTDTTSDKNRNNNIDLACRAINGTTLMPGETFSFNQATGQRTIDKGYKEAGAISAGQSIDEVGGGICQVSSTLFNAVARADLEIVSRSPHAWPSTYVNRGEDATVNWPNLDFKFKNNKDTPVFVITYYNSRKVSAEIYGMALADSMTIDLESTVVKKIDPPYDTKYVNNPSLPSGTSKETVKARTGYVVDTYKVWYQGKTEVKRELLHTSTYRAYQQTIEYN